MRHFRLRKHKREIPAAEDKTSDVASSSSLQSPVLMPEPQPIHTNVLAASVTYEPILARASAQAIKVSAESLPSVPRLPDISSTGSDLGEEEISEGLRVLVSKPADATDCVDIVALHGLGGHLMKTWTWTGKNGSRNWLNDEKFLPQDVDNARIMTFGYNSARYFSRSEADVRDFASGLLIALKSKRRGRGEKNRPIVFLCHSLGGLVFKQAVVLAHEQNEHYSVILDNIRGVVFFGTPHRGSDLAFWDSIGTSMMSAASLAYLGNTKMSNMLKVDSKMLKDITDSFAHRGGKFKIRSFFELDRMPGLPSLVVEQHSAKLGWPNELTISAATNHTDLVKFSSSSEQRYLNVAFVISELVGGQSEDNDAPFNSIEERCMSGLNSDYEDHLGQVDDPVPGTCGWVTTHETWQKWVRVEDSALLWITADAGCGKSVAAKFLVHHLTSLPISLRTRHICYFFFREGLEDQDNASAAMSAMLHQLCTSQRGLIQHITKRFTSMPQKAFNRFSSLWSMFLAVLKEPNMQGVTWILDGLDECEPRSLNELLKGLVAYLDAVPNSGVSSPGAQLKMILLSRPHNKIQQALRLGRDKEEHEIYGRETRKACNCGDSPNRFRLIAEEQTDAIAKDIARFIRFKVSELEDSIPASELLPDMLADLESKLISGADYTFLWISLVMKLIEDARVDGISMIQLESILNTTRLDDVYEKLLSGKALPLKARKALMLVLAAVRPLSLREMSAAIDVDQDHFPSDGEPATRERLASFGHSTVRLGEKVNIKATVSQKSKAHSLLRQDLKTFSVPQSSRNIANSATAEDRESGATPPAGIQSPSAARSLHELGMLMHNPFANHLRQICGHFLRIRGTKVYLVHQTARRFLLTRPGSVHLDEVSSSTLPASSLGPHSPKRRTESEEDETSAKPDLRLNPGLMSHRQPKQLIPKWQHSIRIEDANHYLLRTCAEYLRLFRFDECRDQYATPMTGKVVNHYLKAIHNDLPRAFFKYAAFHWIDHYRPVRQQLDFSFDYLLDPTSPYFNIWVIVHRSWVPDEERSTLEAGAVDISGQRDDDMAEPNHRWQSVNHFYSKFDNSIKKGLFYNKRSKEMHESWFERQTGLSMNKKQQGSLEAVLDHFNLNFGEEMELWDDEFLVGDRWWKKHKEDKSTIDSGEDGEGSDEDEGRKIPDRVQYYRRQHRDNTLDRLAEMSNPLSPMMNNPNTIYSGTYL